MLEGRVFSLLKLSGLRTDTKDLESLCLSFGLCFQSETTGEQEFLIEMQVE